MANLKVSTRSKKFMFKIFQELQKIKMNYPTFIFGLCKSDTDYSSMYQNNLFFTFVNLMLDTVKEVAALCGTD